MGGGRGSLPLSLLSSCTPNTHSPTHTRLDLLLNYLPTPPHVQIQRHPDSPCLKCHLYPHTCPTSSHDSPPHVQNSETPISANVLNVTLSPMHVPLFLKTCPSQPSFTPLPPHMSKFRDTRINPRLKCHSCLCLSLPYALPSFSF